MAQPLNQVLLKKEKKTTEIHTIGIQTVESLLEFCLIYKKVYNEFATKIMK